MLHREVEAHEPGVRPIRSAALQTAPGPSRPTHWLAVAALALAALLPAALAACGPAASPGGEREVENDVAACPEPTDGMRLLVDENRGFCFLYPQAYEVEEPSEDEVVLTIGGLLDVENPKAYLRVEPAGGRTAEQAADETLAEVAEMGMDIGRTNVNVGGREAVLLERYPGQDLGRLVFVVNDDRLYRLTFVPVGPDAGDLGQRTDALYNSVVEVFRFLGGDG